MKPPGAWKVWIMAGYFELFTDHQSHIRFRLLAPGGGLLAVSGPFGDTKAAAAAIRDVRECAGTGLIQDHSLAAPVDDPETPVELARSRNHLRAAAAKRRAVAAHQAWQDRGGLDVVMMEREHVRDILTGLAAQVVSSLSTTIPGVSCGFSLFRPKRSPAFGGSGALAFALNDMQDNLRQGPGMTAMAGQAPVLVGDLTNDCRWPVLTVAAAGMGITSVLAVPAPAEGGSSVILTLCGDRPDALSLDKIRAAEQLAGQAARTLRTAPRVEELKDLAEDLQTALANNTVIDTALGVVMAQNHCGHDTAFDVLVRAADSRNTKVRDVAAAVVASVSAARFRSRQERIRQIQHRWAQFRAK
jgi:hypothetical protein